jgi:hypothetical protein
LSNRSSIAVPGRKANSFIVSSTSQVPMLFRSTIARLQYDLESVEHLLPVMLYIGSLFAPEALTEELRENALSHVQIANMPLTGFNVLAILLTTMAIHGEDYAAKSRSLLNRAITLALGLGINFSKLCEHGSRPISERKLETNVLGTLR